MIPSRYVEKTLPTLIKELDTVFSEYVRRSEADSLGYIKCFITGEKLYWKLADAAHYIKRDRMATRWHEMNVHATSIHSNRFDLKHDLMYDAKMIEVYGLEKVSHLQELSQSLAKWTHPELIEKIEFYKSELRLMKV